MARVLVTGVGGVGGVSSARWLLTETEHEPVGVDMNPRARGFFELDRWEVVPRADAPEWPAAMASVVTHHDVDAIVPLVDEELARIEALREAVSDEVAIVAPRPGAVEKTLDKRRFARWIEATDLSAPESVCPDDEADLDAIDLSVPIVVKPRLGHGSTGVERVDSIAALRAYFDRYPYEPGDVVCQESVDGAEFTTSVVSTTAGECLAVVPKAVVEKEGNTDWGVTRAKQTVERTCREVHETLDPRGPVNVQQIVDHESGEAKIVEINPRFSSTACLTARAGVDEFDLLIRDALGESVDPPDGFETGIHLVRSSADRFASGEELASRGLFDEGGQP
ncbi:ATP-grasp domain-containing protein [Halovivax gelatinilyticus]|uniref:ATP-grasp domain-containing protein n=1 Tax=Halovivax gelatinilyticus TaxID=2961597 RepID=UPI0020CA5A46|nr:ATP-grasp domain-containing protein [Halovivax gelatinilyticus]